MTKKIHQEVSFEVDETQRVSGILQTPPGARHCYVLAHGAGADMKHPFMQSVADELAARRIATLRYQFPYTERGSKRPDTPKVAQTTVRAAIAAISRLAPELSLIAGGKSFGGRMTSQAQAIAPLAGVRGIAFLGFPLHPAGKPSLQRADHLDDVRVPMLFLQGTRDALADTQLMQKLVARLGERATLKLFPDADHSFHVPKKTGRTDSDVRREMMDTLANWIRVLP